MRLLFKFICSKHGLCYYTDQESEHSNYNQTESMMIVMMQCVNVCVNCTQRNWRERTISISLRHVREFLYLFFFNWVPEDVHVLLGVSVYFWRSYFPFLMVYYTITDYVVKVN